MFLFNRNGPGFGRPSYRLGYRYGAARPLVSIVLALSVIFPSGLMTFKAGIFFIVLAMLLIPMLKSRVSLSLNLYLVSMFYAFVGLTWSCYGEMLGNPGALKVMTLMVIYPIFIPLCSPLYRREDASSLYKLFLACAWIIVATDLIYAFAYFTFTGNMMRTILTYIYGDVNTDVQLSSSSISVHLMNVNSIIFLLPFFLSYLFFSKSPAGKKVYIYLLVLLMFITGLLANRRALLLTAILGPATAFILTSEPRQRWDKVQNRRWWVLLCSIGIVIGIVFVLNPSISRYYLDLIASTFDFKDNESNHIRVSQFSSLLNGISDAPLWGHGAGAVASVVRSDVTPWVYELTYIAFIFQYGIICFLIYASGVVFLCWQLILSIKDKGRSSFEFYLLCGFISYMLANATNPYLGAFDSMWVLFIPYAVVNRRLLQRKLRIDLARANVSLTNCPHSNG
jgi:hypothetical protein